MDQETGTSKQPPTSATVSLQAHLERRLIPATSSSRYVDFFIRAEHIAHITEQQRLSLKLAIVLDRSGSMQGHKIETAKHAVLAVLDQLTPRDAIALAIFDDQIDVIQELATVTAERKSQIREILSTLQARASTALHEGWLAGCNALTGSIESGGKSQQEHNRLARCFLLTDGIANVGITDPEHIASEAAGVREHTNISTSTFGIGNDYNELLLGPMAVAGGGQFHHLRTADEITKTFVGELGGLLAVAVRHVRLELELEPEMQAELISPYWEHTSSHRHSIAIGDLQSEEERHVVIRLGFPEQGAQEMRVIRARLVWQGDENEFHTDWQELRFFYASESACDGEAQNADVMHQVGLHEADRARREAISANNRGDLTRARDYLKKTAQAVSAYAGNDSALQNEIHDLYSLDQLIESAPMAAPVAKEVYYKQQLRSRQQADYRSDPSPEPPANPTSTEPKPIEN
ncbi:MAG TPA: VWA domain-containing protein [Ktedonobacteraceae bacterium]|jgi:Mg-chelatase subunit ChlD